MLNPIQILLMILFFTAASVSVYLFFSPSAQANWLVLWRNLGRQTTSILPAPARLPFPLSQTKGLHLGWIGHATWLMEIMGVRILTDPVFSNRILMNRRLVQPAMRPGQIRQLDGVLLTHAHYDHLDLPSLQKLPPTAALIHPQGDEDLLQGLFQSKKALIPGQSVDIQGLMITALPTRHHASRPTGLHDRRTLAYLLEKEGRRVVFCGDTAYSEELIAGVKSRCPDGVDAFLVPIGAYEPPTFQKDHCTPEEALHMALAIGARHILPMHHHTFILSLEPPDEPLALLKAAANKLGVADKLVILPIGGKFSI